MKKNAIVTITDGNLRWITHVDQDNRILAQFTYSYYPGGLIEEIEELIWCDLMVLQVI